MYRAIAKNVPFSQYKLRLYADVIRSKKVDHALRLLKSFRDQRSVVLYKVVFSAFSNAKNLLNINEGNADKKEMNFLDQLYINEIRVDQGVMRRYFAPSARGRAKLQKKRHCHIFVSLAPLSGGSDKKILLKNEVEVVREQ